MGVRSVTLGPSLRDALADRALRAPWVVLAGGSFGTRHHLLQDTLEPLVFPETPTGDVYRDGARRIAVVEPDLRRGVEALCAALDAPRSDDARRVVVVEEAHALLRMEPLSRARVAQALAAVVGEGRDGCVVLATNEHALTEVTALFAGEWGAESVVRLPPAVWPRRIAWATALLVLTAGIAWGESHRRWRAEVRAVGIQRAQDRATLPSLRAAMTSRESHDEQRALAAAMAEIELRSRGGQGDGTSRLIDDRGAGWASGPWVLRADGRTGGGRWWYSLRTRRLDRVEIWLEERREEVLLPRSARIVDGQQVEVSTFFYSANPARECFNLADARRVECPPQAGSGTKVPTPPLSVPGSAIAVDAERALEYEADGDLTLRDTQRNRVVAQLGRVDLGGGSYLSAHNVLRANGALSVRLSADRSRGLHVTGRGALRVWDARTGRHFASLVPTSGVRFIDAAFTQDAQRVVTLDARGGIERWHLRPEDPRALLDEHLAETNLRVCRNDLRVVLVPLPLDAETRRSPWAPSRACASGR